VLRISRKRTGIDDYICPVDYVKTVDCFDLEADAGEEKDDAAECECIYDCCELILLLMGLHVLRQQHFHAFLFPAQKHVQ